VYSHPATPFVADFVGLSNAIACEVRGGRAAVLELSVPTLAGSISSGRGLAMVRPESVTVESDPAGAATVTSVSFLGPVSRVNCELAGGMHVTAQVNSARMAITAGTRVRLGVQADAVLVVPNGPG
jgi:putative spermidine/putrescine transport system ATP-binding protein